MDFYDIGESAIVSPGEYVFYVPSHAIVLCGAFNKEENFMRVFTNGRLIEDKIENFKKIKLSRQEQKERKKSRCKGCGHKQ